MTDTWASPATGANWPPESLETAYPPRPVTDLVLFDAAGDSLTWIAEPGQGDEMPSPKTLQKYPEDSRVYSFDYSLQPEIQNGDTLASAVVTASPDQAGDLVLTSVTVDAGNNLVEVTIADGRPGATYQVSCVATTTAGAIIETVGLLFVIDPSLLGGGTQ